MNKKGISYISIFIWVILILFALLLEKGVTTYIANVLEINTEFITSEDGIKIFKTPFSIGPTVEIALQTILFVLVLLFISRYLILSPYRIYRKIWGDDGEKTRNLSDEIVFSRYMNVSLFDLIISSFYFLIEFFLSYILIISLGNHQLSIIILLSFPFIDFFLGAILGFIFLILYPIYLFGIFLQGGLKHYQAEKENRINSRFNLLLENLKEERKAIFKYLKPNAYDFIVILLSSISVCIVFAIANYPHQETYSFFEYLISDISNFENQHLHSPMLYGIILGLLLSNIFNYPINSLRYQNAFDILQRTSRLRDRITSNRISRRLKGQSIFNQNNYQVDQVVFLTRFSAFEPLPYIIGSISFYGLRLKIDRRCYIPNIETEILVEVAIKLIQTEFANKEVLIYDVGTGCGNIALGIAKSLSSKKNSKIIAIDIDHQSIELAQENINTHGFSSLIQLKNGDLVTNETIEPSIIISDLPYGSMRTLLPSLDKDEIAHYPPISVHTESSLGEYVRLINQIIEKGWETTLFIETGLVTDQEINQCIPYSESFRKEIFRYDNASDYSVTKIDFI